MSSRHLSPLFLLTASIVVAAGPRALRAQVVQSGDAGPRSAPAATAAEYRRAEQFLTWNELRHIYGDFVAPRPTGRGDRFWYRVHTPRGYEFVVVDPATLRRSLLFDNGRLAAAMSAAADTAYDPTKLPFSDFRFGNDGRDERYI